MKFSFEDGPSLNFAEGVVLLLVPLPACLASPHSRPVLHARLQELLARAELCAVACAAALVIQGSACVYSKKVEYLHKLVYQALEFIAEKRSVQQELGNA